jgi:hypothetical protein
MSTYQAHGRPLLRRERAVCMARLTAAADVCCSLPCMRFELHAAPDIDSSVVVVVVVVVIASPIHGLLRVPSVGQVPCQVVGTTLYFLATVPALGFSTFSVQLTATASSSSTTTTATTSTTAGIGPSLLDCS